MKNSKIDANMEAQIGKTEKQILVIRFYHFLSKQITFGQVNTFMPSSR